MYSVIRRVITVKILESVTLWKIISLEIHKCKASKYGVQYIVMNKKHQIALFQDPITGSSFAIREGRGR